ncbi:hypothetical protein F2Q70_00029378 [Brassica cretica]|uniref:Uncharacterized protein n=1 Tax=Brassica cretica TaxID=69181 RepID=A0A8S9FI76_BRACR|nr:hypothetical protein F2Q70_00029378 [Brassica cretica]
MFNDDEKWAKRGDRPFTKAKRSNRDVFDQNELQTYASLEKMLHNAIHVIRQLKKKGNTNTSSTPKQQSNFSSLSNSDLKTNVLSSDKSKAVKPTSKAILPDLRTNLFEEEGNDVPRFVDQSIGANQHGDQDVLNNLTEVRSSDRTDQTDRAVPCVSRLELRLEPRLDD